MTDNLNGYACVPLKNDKLELLIARDFGPRILSLRAVGGENLFAEMPDHHMDTPFGQYHLRGGHRLWHAPENMPRTYVPDNETPEITVVENGLRITQATESQTSIQKQIEVTLDEKSVRVVHRLTNHSLWPVELAPWALTMLKPGGTAVFPETSRRADPSGLLPNRNLILWPYTQFSDPRMTFSNHLILVKATTQHGAAFKFGYANSIGWQAYYRPDLRTWFIKVYQHHEDATYPDMGSSSECYCCGYFIELETLGPLVKLQPGSSISHTEIWYVWPNLDFEDLAHIV